MIINNYDRKCRFTRDLQVYALSQELPMAFILEDHANVKDWSICFTVYIHTDGVKGFEFDVYHNSYLDTSNKACWVTPPSKERASCTEYDITEYCAAWRCTAPIGAHVVTTEGVNNFISHVVPDLNRVTEYAQRITYPNWLHQIFAYQKACLEMNESDLWMSLDVHAHGLTSLDEPLNDVIKKLNYFGFEHTDLMPISTSEFIRKHFKPMYCNQFGIEVMDKDEVEIASFQDGYWLEAKLVERRLQFFFANGDMRRYSAYELECDKHLISLSLQELASNEGFYLTHFHEGFNMWLAPLHRRIAILNMEEDSIYQSWVQENIEYINSRQQSKAAKLSNSLDTSDSFDHDTN
ncbi:TPA: hypothetical protein NGR52_004237 [Vibrio parahaemolyticus]|nr:hypothetical protein [Vibrio parahaemolyticus]